MYGATLTCFRVSSRSLAASSPTLMLSSELVLRAGLLALEGSVATWSCKEAKAKNGQSYQPGDYYQILLTLCFFFRLPKSKARNLLRLETRSPSEDSVLDKLDTD